MRKNSVLRRKGLIVGLTGALVVTSSAVAFAWWSSLGAADTTVTTASGSSSLTVTMDAPSGSLQPGGPDVTVPFTVTNPGNAPLMLKNVISVTFESSGGEAWVAPDGCAPEAYHASGTLTGGAGEIAAGASKTGTVTISMDNLPSDQSACMDASLPLHVSVS